MLSQTDGRTAPSRATVRAAASARTTSRSGRGRRPSVGTGGFPARTRARRSRARGLSRRARGHTTRRGERPCRRGRRPTPRTQGTRRPTSARPRDRPARSRRPARWLAGGVAVRPRRSTSEAVASALGTTSRGQAPADLADQPDQRHPDDPREGRPQKRQREDARPLGGRRPLGRRGDCRRVRDPDPNAASASSGDEHRERGSDAAQKGPARQDDYSAQQQLSPARAVRPGAPSRERPPRRRAPRPSAAGRQRQSRRRGRGRRPAAKG